MCNLSTRDGTNCGGLYGRHSSRVSVERHELDLDSLAVSVDVNHRADVADLQALVGYGRGQHDPIVFFNHAEGSLLARIRGHESRSFVTPVDDPYRSDQPLTAVFSVRRQPPLDNIFLAVDRIGTLNDVAVFRDGQECGHQALRILDREAEGLEEPRLAAVVGMSGVQQVVNDFLSLDYGEMRIAKPHVVGSLSHDDGDPAQRYSPLPVGETFNVFGREHKSAWTWRKHGDDALEAHIAA